MYMYKHNVCYIFSSVATSKQGDSLEDFKKIAERNGITVCPAGNFKFKAHHSVLVRGDLEKNCIAIKF